MPRRKRVFTQKNLRAMGMRRSDAKLAGKASAAAGCSFLVATVLAATVLLIVAV